MLNRQQTEQQRGPQRGHAGGSRGNTQLTVGEPTEEPGLLYESYAIQPMVVLAGWPAAEKFCLHVSIFADEAPALRALALIPTGLVELSCEDLESDAQLGGQPSTYTVYGRDDQN